MAAWFFHLSIRIGLYHRLRITGFLLAAMALSSCEKVIDLDIEAADKRYVVEGIVTNQPGTPVEVRLSQTKNFEDENTFSGISGATVTIQVGGSTVYTLAETSAGIYSTTAFTGVPGEQYLLTVNVNGNSFTGLSKMPSQLVSLDTLTVEDLGFGGSTTKTVSPSYLDPAGLGNSYRFVQYANGIQAKRVFVQNDELSDGLRITRPFVDPDGELESGDIVKVEMQHIDANVYRYWYSLDQASTGSGQSAAPSNPVSNISGGALGYFSAHSISTKVIQVP
ncbi:MAG TPA: DUF4249 domain-containing protein [Flavisolibacter sp.]|nr:DUF4249 domain-containing protein [Flavisolibacter sp.]